MAVFGVEPVCWIVRTLMTVTGAEQKPVLEVGRFRFCPEDGVSRRLRLSLGCWARIPF